MLQGIPWNCGHLAVGDHPKAKAKRNSRKREAEDRSCWPVQGGHEQRVGVAGGEGGHRINGLVD